MRGGAGSLKPYLAPDALLGHISWVRNTGACAKVGRGSPLELANHCWTSLDLGGFLL